MSKATRMNISVPQDLKGRMDAVEEDVNWSALACRAFGQKLAEIISRKGAKEMGDVIARLRASKQSVETERFVQGVGDGREWAMNRAGADELQRLEDMRAGLSRSEWEWSFEADDNRAYSAGEMFVFNIHPDGDGDRQEAASFWSGVVGLSTEELMHDGKYVLGFANGALEVWGEVKDQL